MRNKNTTRQRTSKRGCYKVTNWSEYNRSLKTRGSLCLWVSDDICSKWYHAGPSQQGAQVKYSEICIEACCTVRKVYRLPYRQTEGLLRSIIKLSGLGLQAPDYSVICRRSKALNIVLPVTRVGESLHIVMDSTGLKVFGEGEWKVRQHGWGKHRTWRKIHIAIDPTTGEVQAAQMTSNGVDDASVAEPLLNQVKRKIKTFRGDGGYDKTKVYGILKKYEIRPIIPPQKNARIKKHGNCRGRAMPRDKAIRYIRLHGRKKWKCMTGYHKRSIVENTMYRYKTILGDKLQARTFKRQTVEALLSCKILNKMALCGMPKSVKIN